MDCVSGVSCDGLDAPISWLTGQVNCPGAHLGRACADELWLLGATLMGVQRQKSKIPGDKPDCRADRAGSLSVAFAGHSVWWQMPS